jgi:DNA-binding transcriptional ArsR family regulator
VNLTTMRVRGTTPGRSRLAPAEGPEKRPMDDSAVLAALEGGPRSLAELASSLDRQPGSVSHALERLRRAGKVLRLPYRGEHDRPGRRPQYSWSLNP